jgi:hypothetical protein
MDFWRFSLAAWGHIDYVDWEWIPGDFHRVFAKNELFLLNGILYLLPEHLAIFGVVRG